MGQVLHGSATTTEAVRHRMLEWLERAADLVAGLSSHRTA